MDYKKRLKRTLLILLLPMVSYGLLGPLEIYFGNTKDFYFVWTDFFGIFLILSLTVWLIAGLLLALLPDGLNRVGNCLILGIGVGSYIQNMFMNIKLSESNGGPMKWEELGRFPVINMVIWLIIMAAAICLFVFLKKNRDMIAVGIAAFLSAIQLVAVFSLVIPALLSGEGSKVIGYPQVATTERFQVAKNNNTIIFVLDTFGNVQLEEALEKYPDLTAGLNDFTYYNNADCHYYCTFPSMTHMLTGAEFDFQMRSEEWLEQSWTSDKAKRFYDLLHNQGYTCNLYSPANGYVYGNLFYLEDKFDNIRPVAIKTDYVLLTKKLAKMSIYRYVPYLMKPYFEVLTNEFDGVVYYAEGDICTDDNGEFYRLLLENPLQINSNMENALIIQHLFGSHEPHTLNERAEIVETAERNETIKGLTVIVDEYLQQLKDIGVYDDATIIITADHGAWYGFDTQPVFFLKQAGETHTSMEVSTAPISLDDMQATILSVAGEDYSDYGTSVFDWKDGEQRERTVYARMMDKNYPKLQGLAFNAYYKYTYMTDRQELYNKVVQGPDEIIPAVSW